MSQSELTDRLDDLEAQLDDQQETIERQQERIDEQAATIERQQERLEEQDAVIDAQRERLDEEATPACGSEQDEPETAAETSDSSGAIATRRGVLTSAGLLGLLGLGAGTASADASGQIGTSSDPLQDFYTANLHGDSGTVTLNDELDLNGNNVETSTGGLTVTTNDNGDLTLDPGSGNNLVLNNQQSNDASLLTIDASGNVGKGSKSISDIGGGTPSSLVTSNSDTTALEVSDNGDVPNIVGGKPENFLKNSPKGAVISGGGSLQDKNSVQDNFASIGGGAGNIASDFAATVSGGYVNKASGGSASVPGGRYNRADGSESFAAGRLAEAADMQSFVWNDGKPRTAVTSTHGDGLSSANAVSSETVTGSYTFSASAANGFRFITGGDTSPSVVTIDDDGSQNARLQSWSGGMTVKTSSSDLTLNPSGNIDLNSNRISNAKEIHSDENNITFKGSADVNLDGSILADKGGDMDIISTNSVNVDIDNDSNDSDGTRDFNVTKDGGSTTLFTVNDGGQVDIFQGDLDFNSNGGVVNTSDARLKTAIEPIENPTEKLTELEPRTYEWKDDEAADGREAGVIAQSVKDALPEAVKEDEDGFLKLAYRQLTPLVIGAVQDQQDEIETLEADLDAKDARIEDQQDRIERLEAENERLCERNAALENRLAAVEAELGIHATASQQGVADD